MKIVVLGASGLSGKSVVAQALRRGFEVTAYVRKSGSLVKQSGLNVVVGELSDEAAMTTAFRGAQAVICCLGTRSMRFAKRVTLMQESLPRITSSLQKAGVERIVVLSAYGVGETRLSASLVARLIYKFVVPAIYADKERAEVELVQSPLKWTLIYPVALTNEPATDEIDVRPLEEIQKVRGLPKVSRASVAKVMLDAVEDDRSIGRRLIVTSRA